MDWNSMNDNTTHLNDHGLFLPAPPVETIYLEHQPSANSARSLGPLDLMPAVASV
jgi:hypothetical protein